MLLHSLRHSLAQRLEHSDSKPTVNRRLLGHALCADVESRVYLAGLTYSVKELSEALEAVKFPMPEPRPALAPEGSGAMPSEGSL